jgi:hypothetical protein
MSYRITRAAAGALAGLALTLLFASQALAARPDTSGWSQLVSPSGHFLVHYGSEVPAAAAQAAAASFDSAYATEVGSWGFHAPLDDGDGLIDVYVADTGSNLGEAYHDDPYAPTTSGYVLLSPSAAGDAGAAAHELFHLIQYATYAHGAKFLVEGTAEWAAANVTHETGWLYTYWSNPEQPLECLPASPCAPSPDQDHSYSRWLFFEHLSERYGPGVVSEIIQRAGALGAERDAALDLQAIDDVLAARGSSLAEELNAFAAAGAGGAYTFPGLSGSGHYPRPAAVFYTGVSSLTLPDRGFAVDHLAADYVSFVSGDSRFSSAGCGAATLHIRLTLPAASGSQPALADATGLHPLSVSGDGAGIDLPWSTCAGSSALLALPNASRSLDGAQFGVHSWVSVTPSPPSGGSAAPRIRLAFPRRAAIARLRPRLRFTVTSSAKGTLQVLLKWRYVRGSFSLHKGVNRLDLRLPRRFRGGRHQLVFTAYSTTGARGSSLERHVRIGFAARA